MPRPRLTAADAERTGAWKKDPQRKRKEPKASGRIGDAPEFLTEDQRRVWDRLKSQAHKNVLTAADETVLAQAAILRADLEANGAQWTAALHAQLRYVMGELGFTPASRSKVSAQDDEEKEDDPYAKFRVVK